MFSCYLISDDNKNTYINGSGPIHIINLRGHKMISKLGKK